MGWPTEDFENLWFFVWFRVLNRAGIYVFRPKWACQVGGAPFCLLSLPRHALIRRPRPPAGPKTTSELRPKRRLFVHQIDLNPTHPGLRGRGWGRGILASLFHALN